MRETNIQIAPCWPSQPPLPVSCDIRVVVQLSCIIHEEIQSHFRLKKRFPWQPTPPLWKWHANWPPCSIQHTTVCHGYVWEDWVFFGKLASGLLPDVRQLQHFSYYSSDASTRIKFWQCWDSKAKRTHIQNRWMTETSWTGGLEQLHALEQLHGLEEALRTGRIPLLLLHSSSLLPVLSWICHSPSLTMLPPVAPCWDITDKSAAILSSALPQRK